MTNSESQKTSTKGCDNCTYMQAEPLEGYPGAHWSCARSHWDGLDDPEGTISEDWDDCKDFKNKRK